MPAKRLIWLGCIILTAVVARCAELNCSVEINADRIPTTAREVFTTLQQAMAEYLNTTSFTEAQFSSNEKIDCKFFLTVNSYADNVVTGSLQVQSTRPVFDSTYTTPLLNIKDNDISFSYSQGEPLTFSHSEVTSNLTALLDFYAYLIIALDFDSFSSHGGTPYYEEADRIVQLSRSGAEKGWRAIDDPRNRASMLAALTEPPASAIRDIIFTYHRQGLDRMTVSPDKGRTAITGCVRSLAEIAHTSPMSAVLPLFHDTKLDELTGVYSKSAADERKEVARILAEIYPTATTLTERIANPSN
ncbi:MAG: DUF4835 family protein [Bacteroides sp.]|nr:DUF4835 family protein [Barnesiella sp.]MBD5324908.1 DUF4835 family protein [Bacteroides sp.]